MPRAATSSEVVQDISAGFQFDWAVIWDAVETEDVGISRLVVERQDAGVVCPILGGSVEEGIKTRIDAIHLVFVVVVAVAADADVEFE